MRASFLHQFAGKNDGSTFTGAGKTSLSRTQGTYPAGSPESPPRKHPSSIPEKPGPKRRPSGRYKINTRRRRTLDRFRRSRLYAPNRIRALPERQAKWRPYLAPDPAFQPDCRGRLPERKPRHVRQNPKSPLSLRQARLSDRLLSPPSIKRCSGVFFYHPVDQSCPDTNRSPDFL